MFKDATIYMVDSMVKEKKKPLKKWIWFHFCTDLDSSEVTGPRNRSIPNKMQQHLW